MVKLRHVRGNHSKNEDNPTAQHVVMRRVLFYHQGVISWIYHSFTTHWITISRHIYWCFILAWIYDSDEIVPLMVYGYVYNVTVLGYESVYYWTKWSIKMHTKWGIQLLVAHKWCKICAFVGFRCAGPLFTKPQDLVKSQSCEIRV